MHPEACYRGMCGCAGHARYAPKQTSACLAFIRTSVSHNSLKSSPISLILLYLSSSRQCQNAHTICGETLWLFYLAISCRTKQLSTHNFLIPPYNCIKQTVKWDISEYLKANKTLKLKDWINRKVIECLGHVLRYEWLHRTCYYILLNLSYWHLDSR